MHHITIDPAQPVVVINTMLLATLIVPFVISLFLNRRR